MAFRTAGSPPIRMIRWISSILFLASTICEASSITCGSCLNRRSISGRSRASSSVGRGPFSAAALSGVLDRLQPGLGHGQLEPGLEELLVDLPELLERDRAPPVALLGALDLAVGAPAPWPRSRSLSMSPLAASASTVLSTSSDLLLEVGHVVLEGLDLVAGSCPSDHSLLDFDEGVDHGVDQGGRLVGPTPRSSRPRSATCPPITLTPITFFSSGTTSPAVWIRGRTTALGSVPAAVSTLGLVISWTWVCEEGLHLLAAAPDPVEVRAPASPPAGGWRPGRSAGCSL